jgi:hypothetical protein
MKHIKKYKVFEHTNHAAIKDTIQDILSPLSDNGIVVEVLSSDKTLTEKYYGIEIYMNKPVNSKGFTLTPYKDELKHLNDFMEGEGWVISEDMRVFGWAEIRSIMTPFNQWISALSPDPKYVRVPLFYTPKDNKRRRFFGI